jgi:antitoxin component of RelBE/YafQ-DinJ toxin-antitoxin module
MLKRVEESKDETEFFTSEQMQAICKGIPFSIRAKTFNDSTLAALQEVKDMKSGKIPKTAQTVDEFFKQKNK